MKLVQRIKTTFQNDFGIYLLDAEQEKEMEGKYALTQNILSDWALENMDQMEILKKLQPYGYEGIFQTENEAYYFAKASELQIELDRLKYQIEDMKKIEVKKVDWIKV